MSLGRCAGLEPESQVNISDFISQQKSFLVIVSCFILTHMYQKTNMYMVWEINIGNFSLFLPKNDMQMK